MNNIQFAVRNAWCSCTFKINDDKLGVQVYGKVRACQGFMVEPLAFQSRVLLVGIFLPPAYCMKSSLLIESRTCFSWTLLMPQGLNAAPMHVDARLIIRKGWLRTPACRPRHSKQVPRRGVPGGVDRGQGQPRGARQRWRAGCSGGNSQNLKSRLGPRQSPCRVDSDVYGSRE